MEDDDEDYEDVFAPPADAGLCLIIPFSHYYAHVLLVTHAPSKSLRLTTKLSSKSWVGPALFLHFRT